jgi:hypothetical protein
MYQKGFIMLPPRMANYGAGFDVKEDSEKARWYNFDTKIRQGVIFWDMTMNNPNDDYTEKFDGGVINHVLCTMNDYQAHLALVNIHRTLKPGATLTVIDMDLLKVFDSYQEGRIEDIPIEEGSIDDRLCCAISGYGTRKSLYTPKRMETVLIEAGFRIVKRKESSEYDTRPKESLIFEATK